MKWQARQYFSISIASSLELKRSQKRIAMLLRDEKKDINNLRSHTFNKIDRLAARSISLANIFVNITVKFVSEQFTETLFFAEKVNIAQAQHLHEFVVIDANTRQTYTRNHMQTSLVSTSSERSIFRCLHSGDINLGWRHEVLSVDRRELEGCSLWPCAWYLSDKMENIFMVGA